MRVAALAVAPAAVLLSGGIAPFDAHVPSVTLPAAATAADAASAPRGTVWRRGPAPANAPVRRAAPALAQQVKVTILSTMLSGDPGRGIGEWGLAALLEADGRRLLTDTGARPGTVSNPRALAVAHVTPARFLRRPLANGGAGNSLPPHREAFERLGGRFVQHEGAAELLPASGSPGPFLACIPSATTVGIGGRSIGTVQTPAGVVDDDIPDDASIVVTNPQGLVVITGCGRAGIVNMVTRAQALLPGGELHAVVGGLPLFNASDKRLAGAGRELEARGVDVLPGVHCTGSETTYRLRAAMALTRRAATTGAVGASFTLGAGIDPLALARSPVGTWH
jgi:7,8-dihydropterin-6-yl-methyl-4-(beta-D-ribofuranosyl)aminobenzene 5'-phosphate synthase